MEKVLLIIVLLQSVALLAVLAPTIAIAGIVTLAILFFVSRILKRRKA